MTCKTLYQFALQVVCGDSYVEDFVGNSTLVDQMCKLAKQREPSDELAMMFPKIIRLFRKGETHPAFDVLWMAEGMYSKIKKPNNKFRSLSVH